MLPFWIQCMFAGLPAGIQDEVQKLAAAGDPAARP